MVGELHLRRCVAFAVIPLRMDRLDGGSGLLPVHVNAYIATNKAVLRLHLP